MEFMTKAVGPWMDAMPSTPMTAGLQRMQDLAMQISMENAEAAFTFGGKMSGAQTPQEICSFRRSLPKTGCSLRHADAATVQRDRRSAPDVTTRLMTQSNETRVALQQKSRASLKARLKGLMVSSVCCSIAIPITFPHR